MSKLNKIKTNKIFSRKLTRAMQKISTIVSTKDFKSYICSLCPYQCKTCVFCKSFFCRSAKTAYSYVSMLELLNVMIASYNSTKNACNFVTTCYFLKQKICPICESFGNSCDGMEFDKCSSEYLVQMSACRDRSGSMGAYGDDANYINDLYYGNDSDYGAKYYEKYCEGYNKSELSPMLTASKNMATIINNLWNSIDIVENDKC